MKLETSTGELHMWRTVRAQADALAQQSLAVSSTLQSCHGLPRRNAKELERVTRCIRSSVHANRSHPLTALSQSSSAPSLAFPQLELPRYTFPTGPPSKAFKIKVLAVFQRKADEVVGSTCKEKRIKIGRLFGALKEIDHSVKEDQVRLWVKARGLSLDNHALTAAISLSEFFEVVNELCSKDYEGSYKDETVVQAYQNSPTATQMQSTHSFYKDHRDREGSPLFNSRSKISTDLEPNSNNIDTGGKRNMITALSSRSLTNVFSDDSISFSDKTLDAKRNNDFSASRKLLSPSKADAGATKPSHSFTNVKQAQTKPVRTKELPKTPSVLAVSPFDGCLKWQSEAARLVDLSSHTDSTQHPPSMQQSAYGLQEEYGSVEWLRNREPETFIEKEKEFKRHQRKLKEWDPKDPTLEEFDSVHDRLHKSSLQKSSVFDSAWPGKNGETLSLVSERRQHERTIEKIKKRTDKIMLHLNTNALKISRAMNDLEKEKQKEIQRKMIKRHAGQQKFEDLEREHRVGVLKEAVAKIKFEGRQKIKEEIDLALEEQIVKEKQWQKAMCASRKPLFWDPSKSSIIPPDKMLLRKKQEARVFEDWQAVDEAQKERELRLRDDKLKNLRAQKIRSQERRQCLQTPEAMLDPEQTLEAYRFMRQASAMTSFGDGIPFSPWARRPLSPLLGNGELPGQFLLPKSVGQNLKATGRLSGIPGLPTAHSNEHDAEFDEISDYTSVEHERSEYSTSNEVASLGTRSENTKALTELASLATGARSENTKMTLSARIPNMETLAAMQKDQPASLDLPVLR